MAIPIPHRMIGPWFWAWIFILILGYSNILWAQIPPPSATASSPDRLNPLAAWETRFNELFQNHLGRAPTPYEKRHWLQRFATKYGGQIHPMHSSKWMEKFENPFRQMTNDLAASEVAERFKQTRKPPPTINSANDRNGAEKWVDYVHPHFNPVEREVAIITLLTQTNEAPDTTDRPAPVPFTTALDRVWQAFFGRPTSALDRAIYLHRFRDEFQGEDPLPSWGDPRYKKFVLWLKDYSREIWSQHLKVGRPVPVIRDSGDLLNTVRFIYFMRPDWNRSQCEQAAREMLASIQSRLREAKAPPPLLATPPTMLTYPPGMDPSLPPPDPATERPTTSNPSPDGDSAPTLPPSDGFGDVESSQAMSEPDPLSPANDDLEHHPERSLLRNGMLDEGFSGDAPVGWTPFIFGNATLHEETGHEKWGTAGLRITGSGEFTAGIFQTVEGLHPGRWYHAFYATAQKVWGNGRVDGCPPIRREIGVDLSGGTDPQAPSVRYGKRWAHSPTGKDNGWGGWKTLGNRLGPLVTFRATGPRVTIFVRARGWPEVTRSETWIDSIFLVEDANR